eukprot:TRINITY_DN30_c0_g1_i1.p1 TRINITY_DN30_c0_g1~~TRINITY_DN30_c0_g1_i1.p1  ORF type:complete len:2576 (+),score=281.31 TRINITY_DN30_c0_g1_i1:473-8200(+)
MGCGSSKNAHAATESHGPRPDDSPTKPLVATPVRAGQATSTAAAAKGEGKSCCAKTGPGYATPMDAFNSGSREKFLFTACTYVSTGVDSPDYLAVVDCDPDSPTYSTVVSRLYGTQAGDELHHFAWSACASCHDNPNITRRYLVVPGLASGRVYIMDALDPTNVTMHKVIEPDEIVKKTNLTAGHTTHCLADGNVMIAMLGFGDGSAPGGFLLLDGDNDFEIKGRWESDEPGALQMTFNYDFWYQPAHGVMLSSGWGAPSTFAPGFDPADVASGKYSREIHIWDWSTHKIVARVDLDDSGWLPLELRFHHDPDSTHAFVGAALGSSVWHMYLDESRAEWVFEKIIQVAPVPDSPGFPNNMMPGLVTDLLLSMDDKYMYFSCWLHGDVRQYDITNPSRPVLTGRVVVGGMLGTGATVRGNAIVGGPQMLQLSLDGKRMYVTTSLYSTWDNQFYPGMKDAGGCMFMLDIDHENGGMTLNQSFFVDFGKEPRGPSRCHETRYPGGDCTSDIYVSKKQAVKTDGPPVSKWRINTLDLSYQAVYETQGLGAASIVIDRGLPEKVNVVIRDKASGAQIKTVVLDSALSHAQFKVAVQEAVGKVSVIRYGDRILRSEADKEAAVMDAVLRGLTDVVVSVEDTGGSRDHLPPIGIGSGHGPDVKTAYRRVEFALGAQPDLMIVQGSASSGATKLVSVLRKEAPDCAIHGSVGPSPPSSRRSDDEVTIWGIYAAGARFGTGSALTTLDGDEARVAASSAMRHALISIGFSPAMLRLKPSLIWASYPEGVAEAALQGFSDQVGGDVPVLAYSVSKGTSVFTGVGSEWVCTEEPIISVVIFFIPSPLIVSSSTLSGATDFSGTVTKVNAKREHVVEEIDGFPAGEIIKLWIGGGSLEHFPLQRKVQGDTQRSETVTDIPRITKSGGLELSMVVQTGDRLVMSVVHPNDIATSFSRLGRSLGSASLADGDSIGSSILGVLAIGGANGMTKSPRLASTELSVSIDSKPPVMVHLSRYPSVSCKMIQDNEDTAFHTQIGPLVSGSAAFISSVPRIPSRVVAFVVTDIESSTKLWSWNPTVMRLATETHNNIMRHCLASFGGYEIKTEGDAFFIAFSSPLDAVSFCVSARRALLTADWPELLLESETVPTVKSPDQERYLARGLRVRFSVDYGPANQVPNASTKRVSYVSPALNLATRLVDGIHGGQIIATKLVHQVVGKVLASDLEVRDIGDIRVSHSKNANVVLYLDPLLSGLEFPPLKLRLTKNANEADDDTWSVGDSDSQASSNLSWGSTASGMSQFSNMDNSGQDKHYLKTAEDYARAMQDSKALGSSESAMSAQTKTQAGDRKAESGSGSCCAKTGPGYATPMDAFNSGSREKFLFTACTYVSTGVDSPDYLAVVDCDPDSPTYSTVVSRLYGTQAGDELHHFAWSACASCHDNPNITRRYLVVPGLASGRVYIMDALDPTNVTMHKVIEPDEIVKKTNLTAGHTTHCLADGNVMIAMLGFGDGSAPGGFLLLDGDNDFEIKGRWESDEPGALQMTFNYDFWYQPAHGVMLSSGWGAPSTFAPGFDPADVASGKYSREIHIWDWSTHKIVARVDLDDSGWLPLELRFHHDPDSTHAFVGAALGSSVWHMYLDESRAEWVFEKIIQVAPVPDSPGFPNNMMPGLVTDLLLSMDDKYMYFSCWLHGDVRQYDITNPSRPVLTGRVVVGGMLGTGATVRGNAIVGGPQMLQLSLDGKRMYVTTSLYSTWDNQFYPGMKDAGGCMFMLDIDHENGGMTLNQSFFVDFGKEPRGPSRCHETRYPGGDCTSDIYVSKKQAVKTDGPPVSKWRINTLDLSYQAVYETQGLGAASIVIDRGLPEKVNVVIRDKASGAQIKTVVLDSALSHAQFKVAVQEAVGKVSVIRYGDRILRSEADKEAAVMDAVLRGLTDVVVSVEDTGGSRDHLPPIGIGSGHGPDVKTAYRRVEFALGTQPDLMVVQYSGDAKNTTPDLSFLMRACPGTSIHGVFMESSRASRMLYLSGAPENVPSVAIWAMYDSKLPPATGFSTDAQGDARAAAGQAVRAALVAVGFSAAMLRVKPTAVIVSGQWGDGDAIVAGIEDMLGQGVNVIGGLYLKEHASLFAASRTGASNSTSVSVVVSLIFSDTPLGFGLDASASLSSHNSVVTAVGNTNTITTLDDAPVAEIVNRWTAGLTRDFKTTSVELDAEKVPLAKDPRPAALFPLMYKQDPMSYLPSPDADTAAKQGLNVGRAVNVGDTIQLAATTRERLLTSVTRAEHQARSQLGDIEAGHTSLSFLSSAIALSCSDKAWSSIQTWTESHTVFGMTADQVIGPGSAVNSTSNPDSDTQPPESNSEGAKVRICGIGASWMTIARRTPSPMSLQAAFVFHRLEDKEALLAWDRVIMEAAMKTLDDVRHHVSRFYDGYDLHGDGRVIVFSSTIDAIEYALQLQFALLGADWPRDLLFQPQAETNVVTTDNGESVVYERGLKLAIGIHQGTAHRTIDPTTGRLSYVGRNLNVSARLCGLAQPGQILLSLASLQIAKRHLSGRTGARAVDIKSIGEHSLKGVKGNVEVFQVLPAILAEHRYFTQQ